MKDDDIIQEKEEKVYKFGNSTVIVHIPQMTVAQKRKQLRKIYDTINEIARSCEKRGIDTSDWFYTDEEIEKMKKDPRYTFI
ncbi:MAG: hypothetical protein OSJ65_07900 [Bacilli bacterium]|nr:hypothetical protein [Bacilli bacterium]